MDIKIHSEGCGDPGVKGDTCGTSTVFVNGKDLSLKKRGMNFVIVDYTTGKGKEADRRCSEK